MLPSVRVVEIIPARVVEIVPARPPETVPTAVVEIVPVLVVEMVPAFVVEIVPPFAKVGADIAKTNIMDHMTDLAFFIVFAPGGLNITGNLVGSKVSPAKPFVLADLWQITYLSVMFSKDVPNT